MTILEIIHVDEAIVVVNKPAGRIVHPAPGHETGAITDELVRQFPEMRTVGSVQRPGVVHRLDIDTSGVMVFARTQAAYLDLRRQFERHLEVRKTYLAVMHGAPKPRQGTIEEPVGRERLSAVSHWRTLAAKNGLALVEWIIDTGRMHQIRLHAKSLGHPLVGDTLYGDAERDRRLRVRPMRTLLHAVELSFRHPLTHKAATFSAPPPDDLVYCF